MAAMDHDIAIDVHIDARLQSRGLDAVLAYLAERQYGVVARRQLFRLGFNEGAIDVRVRRKRLHVIHHGVYAVGHSVLSRRGQWMAAVLAGGETAVLSHGDAGDCWGIHRSGRSRIEITAPGPVRRAGIEAHVGRLRADEVAVVDGIPITTVPRTILDLAVREPRRRIERAIHEAEVRRLHDALSLPDLIRRYPRRRGARLLRAILADRAWEESITKEALEELFAAFLERHGLPRPATNRWLQIAGVWIEADCVWYDQKVIVELDGYAVHGTRRRFESDRVRDRKLQLAGWKIIRVTWRQLRDDEAELARDLRALLAPPALAA